MHYKPHHIPQFLLRSPKNSKQKWQESIKNWQFTRFSFAYVTNIHAAAEVRPATGQQSSYSTVMALPILDFCATWRGWPAPSVGRSILGKGEGTHRTRGWARIAAGVDEYEKPRPTGVRAPDPPPPCESVSQLNRQHRCKFIWGNTKIEYRCAAKQFDGPTQQCPSTVPNNITATGQDCRLPPRRRQDLRSWNYHATLSNNPKERRYHYSN